MQENVDVTIKIAALAKINQITNKAITKETQNILTNSSANNISNGVQPPHIYPGSAIFHTSLFKSHHAGGYEKTVSRISLEQLSQKGGRLHQLPVLPFPHQSGLRIVILSCLC